jgi:PAS domain-containing protein
MINAIADAAHQLYVDPDQRTEFRRVIEEKGSVENYEIKMYRNDGSIHWVSNNTRVVRDQSGKTLYYEGIVQDITKRKQAEEELELVQLQQRALLDNNPDIAWLKDRERRFIAVNEPFAMRAGMNRKVGRKDGFRYLAA